MNYCRDNMNTNYCPEQNNAGMSYDNQGWYPNNEYNNWEGECEEDDYTDYDEQSFCDNYENFACDPNNVARPTDCALPMHQGECTMTPCDTPTPDLLDIRGKDEVLCGESLKKVNGFISCIGPNTTIDEFMMQIAEYFPDRGEVMFDTISDEMEDFKESIGAIREKKIEYVNRNMKSELWKKKNNYDRASRKLKVEMQTKIDQLKKLIPDLILDEFLADPRKYLQARYDAAAKEASKAGIHVTNEGTDKKAKVAQYTASWLGREADRIECENEEKMCKLNKMLVHLANLSACYATKNKKIAAYNERMENHATCLRNKIAYNDKLLNCLADEIDIAAARKAKKLQPPCPKIEPDAVLTPYEIYECNYF